MKIAFFDARSYDREAFEAANARAGHTLSWLEPRLTTQTAKLAAGFGAVCAFVNDKLDRAALTELAGVGVELVLLRSAGFNHVDLAAARDLRLIVTRVPEYSPYAVAEHAMGLVMALNRKLPRAFARVRDANFALDGLVGFDLHGKSFGIVGTGRTGRAMAHIARGFGCRVLAFDLSPDERFAADTGVEYVPLDKVWAECRIISLHVPLTPETHHILNKDALAQMQRGVMLINTGRGALIDTRALIDALKSGHIGAAGLDVYEEEEGVFFRDLSGQVLQDDVLARLLTFPNVMVTAHQAFLTQEALLNIAETTLASATAFEKHQPLANEVRA